MEPGWLHRTFCGVYSTEQTPTALSNASSKSAGEPGPGYALFGQPVGEMLGKMVTKRVEARRRKVRAMKLRGIPVPDIAAKLNVSERTITRDLDAIREAMASRYRIDGQSHTRDAWRVLERVRVAAVASIRKRLRNGQSGCNRTMMRVVGRTLQSQQRLIHMIDLAQD